MAKKILIAIACLTIAIILIGKGIHMSIDEKLRESSTINDCYREGYYAAQDDYSNNLLYGTTKPYGYDKYKPIFKLAFDAGYGYGYSDALEVSSDNKDHGYSYVDLDQYSDLEWRVYYLFDSF